MKQSHARILKIMRQGGELWNWSGAGLAQLVLSDKVQRVRVGTVNELDELGLIEEDTKKSFYRSHGPSDIHWKLVSHEAQG